MSNYLDILEKPRLPRPEYPHTHLPLMTAMDVPSTVLMQTLWRALQVKRPAGSREEAAFVAWLVNRLPVTLIDEAGNIHVDTRTRPLSRTMFTAHTDTVHHSAGVNTIRIDRTDPARVLWRADKDACLGADDGAGVALLMHMLDAGVAGYYVFFRGEEIGGTGSSWLADNMPDLVQEFDVCVSLDRAGYSDAITHQGMGRCCSDAFAQALGNALTTEDLSVVFMPCDTGIFTDSANLTDLIPECTNLSVGYMHQHGDGEWQDVTWLPLMAAALVKVQWDSLPVERDPNVRDTHIWEHGYYGGTDTLDGEWLTRVKGSLLEDALIDASEGKFYAVRGVVAAHILPDKPEDALRHVDPSRLTCEEYGYYLNELDMGTHEDTILDDLVDYLYKE